MANIAAARAEVQKVVSFFVTRFGSQAEVFEHLTAALGYLQDDPAPRPPEPEPLTETETSGGERTIYEDTEPLLGDVSIVSGSPVAEETEVAKPRRNKAGRNRPA